MALTSGTLLGRYEIVAPVGAGGMGEVYRARDTELGREVAVKVLPADLARNPEARARFEREARAVAALSHPNIVTLFDFGRSDEVSYTVSELLEGESLRLRLRRGPLPWRRAAAIAAEVARGLDAAHRAGIVHRDVKPGNIFLGVSGTAKVLDFGVAWVRHDPSEQTRQSTVLGTVGYMSPEQAHGEKVDGRSDIFSLGCVLYEMLTGHAPFARASASATLLAITGEEPRPFDASEADIPTSIQNVVSTCLQKDPRRRFDSAATLASILAALAQVDVTDSLPTTGIDPVVRRRRPRGLVAAALVGGTLLLGAALLGLFAAGALPGGRHHEVRSLAVLPLANLSPEQDAYFADGMTDALIAELSQIRALRVISRTSVQRYRDSTRALPEIAGELGVDALVEGSVTRAGNRVRVIVQLIRAADERHLLARTFESEMGDILALQRDVAVAVAREVRGSLSPDEQPLLRATVRPVLPEAHEAFLRGRLELHRLSLDSTRRAVELFERAVRLDPGFARGYAGLAEAHCNLAMFMVRPSGEDFALARGAAQRAVELDPDLAEAHTWLAVVRSDSDWEWADAERGFLRALELNPNYARAHERFSTLLNILGRGTEALAHAQQAQQLDPLAPQVRLVVARAYYFSGAYDDCARECGEVLEIDPAFGAAEGFLSLCLEGQGRLAQAVEHGVNANRLLDLDPWQSPELGHVYAAAGRLDDARRVLAALEPAAETGHAQHFSLGLVALALGDRERALAELEKARDLRENWISLVGVDPRLEPLRAEPRFQALLSSMGLPASS